MRRSTPQELDILKLDIDLPFGFFNAFKHDWIETRRRILEHFDIKVRDIVIQKSANGKTHAWIHVEVEEPLTPWQKAKLQFLLGDDHNRAKLNLLRAQRTRSKFDSFNILFSKKVVKDGGDNKGLP